MALSNAERVGRAMELLKKGLASFVEREMEASTGTTGRILICAE